MNDKLQSAWAERLRLRAEGDKLWAESDKLRAEGGKLRAEGNIAWLTAVIEVHGNVPVEWDGDGCTVCGVRYSAREAQEASDAKR